VAKTRAQRKAERRAREARAAREAERDRGSDSRAQKRTQVPESAEVVEAELAEHGADLESLKEAPPAEAAVEEAPVETAQDLPAPAPSRADVGAPAEAAPERISRRERRREEKERERRRKESEKRRQAPAEPQERQRGAVAGFIASCWAELKRVQWPDRDTLVQASAVTLVFIAIAAAYLGALDALFNFLVQHLL
jgi:preprotein translocase SecE subunit